MEIQNNPKDKSFRTKYNRTVWTDDGLVIKNLKKKLDMQNKELKEENLPITVESGGNVGIGTTTPSHQIEIHCPCGNKSFIDTNFIIDIGEIKFICKECGKYFHIPNQTKWLELNLKEKL